MQGQGVGFLVTGGSMWQVVLVCGAGVPGVSAIRILLSRFLFGVASFLALPLSYYGYDMGH